MALRDHYDTLVTIQRYTLAQDSSSGALVESWDNDTQDLSVAVQPLTSRELDLFGKTTAECSHRAYMPIGSDIKPRDRLVEGNVIEVLLGIGTIVYEIVGVEDAAGKQHHLEVLLLQRVAEEVDGG